MKKQNVCNKCRYFYDDYYFNEEIQEELPIWRCVLKREYLECYDEYDEINACDKYEKLETREQRDKTIEMFWAWRKEELSE